MLLNEDRHIRYLPSQHLGDTIGQLLEKHKNVVDWSSCSGVQIKSTSGESVIGHLMLGEICGMATKASGKTGKFFKLQAKVRKKGSNSFTTLLEKI